MSDVNVWNQSNLEKFSSKRFFPTDMLLRGLFSQNYFNIPNKQHEGSVLDIGCLYANNLAPFADRGWRLFGTEVTNDSVAIAKSCCAAQKFDADIRLGFNTDLPFENKNFDILLSMSTLHYEEKLEDVDLALKEFNRVLKNDGVALIQTTAPKHDIFVNSTHLGGHLYKLDMPKDIRHGQTFTFFENSDDFIEIAKKYFSHIEVARCTEDYPKICVDLWLFKLQKV